MPPTVLRHVLQQIAAKLESAEGTAETLAAADADLLVYDVGFEPNIARITRNPARAYMTQLPSIPGNQFARVTFGVEVKGTTALGTAPAWGRLMKACGMQEAAIGTLAIGSVTNGPFRPGERVTGGTSSAIGIVVDRCAATPLKVIVLTGTFQSGEVLTGSASGATATTGGTLTASQGWNYRPTSANGSSLTIGFFHDGKKKTMYGCRGTWVASGKNGDMVKFAFTFEGVYDADADVAMLAPTYPNVVPVTLLSAGLYLDAVNPEFTDILVDIGNELQQLETAQAAKGSRCVRVVGRAPKVSLSAYATLVADLDLHALLTSSSTSYMRVQVGSASANTVVFGFGALSYEGVKGAQRGRLQGSDLDLMPVSPDLSFGDNEVLVSVL